MRPQEDQRPCLRQFLEFVDGVAVDVELFLEAPRHHEPCQHGHPAQVAIGRPDGEFIEAGLRLFADRFEDESVRGRILLECLLETRIVQDVAFVDVRYA